jgi:hypothetical protein
MLGREEDGNKEGIEQEWKHLQTFVTKKLIEEQRAKRRKKLTSFITEIKRSPVGTTALEICRRLKVFIIGHSGSNAYSCFYARSIWLFCSNAYFSIVTNSSWKAQKYIHRTQME